MKTQHTTLNSREFGWLYKTILFFLFTGILCVKLTFSGSSNNPAEIGIHEQRPAIGTRGLGLSRAFISNVDDATSPLWNPAGLASLDSGNLIYDFSQGAISFAYPIYSIGTFGINLIDLNASDRFLLNHISSPIGTFEYGYNQALLSYARQFGALQLGASAGYNRAPYKNSLWSPNYDVGAIVTLSHQAMIGMQVHDINSVSIRDETGTLLRTFEPRFALGATLIPYQIIRWHTCFNVASPGFGTSLEIVTGPLSTNVGSLFSFDSGILAQSWSLGLSFKKWGKQTYYTYLNQNNLEYKHLLSVGVTFGEPILQKVEHTPKTPKKKSVRIAKKYNVSVELMLAIIYVESKFNPKAVSKTGAGGLMQIIPSTARGLGLKVPLYSNKLKPNLNGKVDERFDPEKNIDVGLTYFNTLRKKYHNNITLALGAYNVGPSRVSVRGPLISRGKIYVDKVIERRNLYRSSPKDLETDLNRLETILNN